ncbi:MAG: VOC family protein [Betaproteobacteria bacterium]|nr:VOC family protein [Betaproteobacteria bacterium]MDH5351100.1 VOC family protein [Betaproteobacteria bacterium]
MPLQRIDHYLLQTTDLAATRDWYVKALGMREGPHPDFKFPVVWLYLGDKDVLHVSQGGAGVSENRKRYLGQESQAEAGSGVIDHIAFSGTGLKGMIEHLQALGIPFTQRMVDDQGLYQLFLKDPVNDVKVELSYANAEAIAAGIQPELKASELSR